MSRILEVSGSAAGGVRTHLRQCASVLAQQDAHRVMLAAPMNVLAGEPLPAVKQRLLEIGARPSAHDLATVRELRWLATQMDVVHAHGLRAGALCALALKGLGDARPRLVVTEHNLPVGSPLTRTLGVALEHTVARNADVVLTVSPDLAQRAQRYRAKRVELAVVPAPDSLTNSAQPADLPELSAQPEARVLLTVARLAHQKGLHLLLEAAAQLQAGVAAQQIPDFVWLVAGDGPLRDSLQAQIDAGELPVKLLGARNDAPALMRRADVVIQTSLWEGQPLTIREALHAHAAIVATDVGGTALTAHGGATLVPPQADYLADAVQHLLQNPAEHARARQRAQSATAALPTTLDLQRQLEEVLLG